MTIEDWWLNHIVWVRHHTTDIHIWYIRTQPLKKTEWTKSGYRVQFTNDPLMATLRRTS